MPIPKPRKDEQEKGALCGPLLFCITADTRRFFLAMAEADRLWRRFARKVERRKAKRHAHA